MLIEHILYNLIIAIIVGLVYTNFTDRNPTWVIIACAWLPDIDYLFQFICYNVVYFSTGIVSPIMIRHGDFHNIFMIVILSIIFGYVATKFGERFYDGILCVAIGCGVHLISDILVYTTWFSVFSPFNNITFRGVSILKETGNMFGIGDWNIMLVGICALVFTIFVKLRIDGSDCIYNFGDRLRSVYIVCISVMEK